MNPNKCIALKANKLLSQCSFNKKPNSDYCGIHSKKLNRQTILDKLEEIKTIGVKLKLFSYLPDDKVLTAHQIVNIVISYNETLQRCYEAKAKVLLLQRNIRKWVLANQALKNPKACNNTTDFYSLDSLLDIQPRYFFAFRDNTNGLIYGFHIESFINYVEQAEGREILNPYNRTPIKNAIIKKATKMWNSLINTNQASNLINLAEESDDASIRCGNKTLRYFQKIDIMGYQTNIAWILDASTKILKTIYINLLILSDATIQIIAPNIDVFPIDIIARMRDSIDRWFIMEQLLETINILVSSALLEDERLMGGIIVLTAISKAIPESAVYNSWLT